MITETEKSLLLMNAMLLGIAKKQLWLSSTTFVALYHVAAGDSSGGCMMDDCQNYINETKALIEEMQAKLEIITKGLENE